MGNDWTERFAEAWGGADDALRYSEDLGGDILGMCELGEAGVKRGQRYKKGRPLPSERRS